MVQTADDMSATMQRGQKAPTASSANAIDRDARRAGIRRTGLILASIAVAFFAGVIIVQYSGATSVGIAVLGFAILGFLVVAIGRNVRK